MSLTEYQRKRDFNVTSEPKGGKAKAHRGLRFVVQKHAASHLHYDFRLELNGVLLSWAVPKGPSLDPAVKRLAMHVEDHPIEYGDFEGIIPKGEYGGGTVMLWDKGTWLPDDDGEKSYREGSLKFELKGEKLQGRWMLVRRGAKKSSQNEKHWFLFKERDEFADPDTDIAEEQPLSVKTERTLEQIAADADQVWGANGKTSPKTAKKGSATAKVRRSAKKSKPAKAFSLAAGKSASIEKLAKASGEKRTLPSSAGVELATLVDHAPVGDEWAHEIKFDGYRMLCSIEGGRASLVSRNGKDWTNKFGDLPAELLRLPVKGAVIDGEVVVHDEEGRTSFQLLQNAFQAEGSAPFVFYAFDLLYFNGYDLRDAPLESRKELLQKLIPNSEKYPVKYSEHVVGNGKTFFAEAARLGLEGIISKRLGKPYVAGRGKDWLKVKCSRQEEFVIGGFTKPTGSRTHFGALALGYYNREREFIYAGRVGTGFNARTLKSLHDQFKPLIQKNSPFINLKGRSGQAKDVTWLKPKLVAQIQFSNWTGELQLRHASFQGLREDKPASKVVRDNAVAAETIDSTEEAKQLAKTTRDKKIIASNKPSAIKTDVAGVRLSHPDKVLYREDGFTKLDLAHYYEKAAEWMLPHIENRLLSLVRCPAGSGQKCFFQKHPGEGTSEDLRRFDVTEKAGPEEYLAVYDLPGLVSLVQMGVLEIHQWGSTADKYEKPDRLVIDLDPDPAVKWPQVVTAAKEVKLLLEELDLKSFAKTTGGKGLHIVVPINRRLDWDGAKEFCRALAAFLVAAAPDRYIAKMSKAARKGKIFVDYLRNDRGATAIAPYSTRARPGATVSVPIKWEELDNRLTSDHYTIKNLPARLARLKKDPWADMLSTKQNVTAAMLKTLQSI